MSSKILIFTRLIKYTIKTKKIQLKKFFEKEDKKFIAILEWIYLEIQHRDLDFKKIKANNLEEYNRISDVKLPKILIFIDDIYKWINYLSPNDLEETINVIFNIDGINANKYGVQIIGITKHDMKNIELGRLKIVFNHVDYTELKKMLNGKFINISMDEILEENEKLAKQYERIEKDDADPLLAETIETVVGIGLASTSFIQRRFQVGYARAARILDQLEELGVVSEYRGDAPRKALITEKEAKNIIKKLKQ